MGGARISGLVLAFADEPGDNRNYINIMNTTPDQPNPTFFTGTDPITTIDLESRLTSSGSFSSTATIDTDWLGKFLIKNGGNTIPPAVPQRFLLGSFTSGGPSASLSSYKLDEFGKLAKKP
jgi:hypothetical protein